MTFYQAFYLALGASGKTVGDICKATGIYPSYFSRLKSGQIKDVTWERALAIIEALEMTPNQFRELQLSDKKSGGGFSKKASRKKATRKGE